MKIVRHSLLLALLCTLVGIGIIGTAPATALSIEDCPTNVEVIQ